MTRPGREPTTCRMRGGHANHIDPNFPYVCGKSGIFPLVMSHPNVYLHWTRRPGRANCYDASSSRYIGDKLNASSWTCNLLCASSSRYVGVKQDAFALDDLTTSRFTPNAPHYDFNTTATPTIDTIASSLKRH